MKNRGKLPASVLIVALASGLCACASVGPDGAGGVVGLTPSTSPVAGPLVQQYKDTRDSTRDAGAELAATALEAAITIPLTVFETLLYGDGSTPVPERPESYEDRLASRRLAMGLPAPTNQRVYDRQKLYRLRLEGRLPLPNANLYAGAAPAPENDPEPAPVATEPTPVAPTAGVSAPGVSVTP